MNLSQFILLNEPKKRDVLLHEGMLVGKRVVQDCYVFLFQMSSYYVEVYCSIKSRQVHEFRTFKDTKGLEPYLPGIGIGGLLR
jgi:hypothetical protein